MERATCGQGTRLLKAEVLKSQAHTTAAHVSQGFPGGSAVPTCQCRRLRFDPGQEDSLEKGMASQARGGAATARDPSATAAPGTGPAAGNGVPSFPREDAHSEHLRRSGTGALQGKGSPGHQGKRPLLSRQLEESKGVPALASRAHPAEPSLPTLGPRNTSGSSWRSNGSPSACRGSCSRSMPTSSPCSSSSNSSSFRNSSRSCPGTGSPSITTVGASTLPTSQPGPERYSAPPVLPETPSVIAHGRPRRGERAGSASGRCWRGRDVTWRTGQKLSCLASCRITGGRENKDEQTAELSLGQEQARQHRA